MTSNICFIGTLKLVRPSVRNIVLCLTNINYFDIFLVWHLNIYFLSSIFLLLMGKFDF